MMGTTINKFEHIDKIQTTPYMILETFQPQAKFIKVPLVEEGFFKTLEKKHKKEFPSGSYRAKFYLNPKSYVINQGNYYIFMELSVRFKGI